MVQIDTGGKVWNIGYGMVENMCMKCGSGEQPETWKQVHCAYSGVHTVHLVEAATLYFIGGVLLNSP